MVVKIQVKVIIFLTFLKSHNISKFPFNYFDWNLSNLICSISKDSALNFKWSIYWGKSKPNTAELGLYFTFIYARKEEDLELRPSLNRINSFKGAYPAELSSTTNLSENLHFCGGFSKNCSRLTSCNDNFYSRYHAIIFFFFYTYSLK